LELQPFALYHFCIRSMLAFPDIVSDHIHWRFGRVANLFSRSHFFAIQQLGGKDRQLSMARSAWISPRRHVSSRGPQNPTRNPKIRALVLCCHKSRKEPVCLQELRGPPFPSELKSSLCVVLLLRFCFRVFVFLCVFEN